VEAKQTDETPLGTVAPPQQHPAPGTRQLRILVENSEYWLRNHGGTDRAAAKFDIGAALVAMGARCQRPDRHPGTRDPTGER
jgi:hypothetical protein